MSFILQKGETKRLIQSLKMERRMSTVKCRCKKIDRLIFLNFHDGDYLTPVPQYLQSRSDYDKALLTRTWLSSRANEDVPRTIPIF